MPPANARRNRSSSTNSSLNSNIVPQKKKGKKRVKTEANWKKNKTKLLKNSGKAYTSVRGKQIQSRKMKPACDNCTFNCSTKFTNEERKQIFDTYWALESLQRQRDFLSSCTNIQSIVCRRLKKPENPRTPNCWFAFIKNGESRRICKKILLNTLGIAQRTLRTVIEAKTRDSGIAPVDRRGRHGNHKVTDPEVLESVRQHINSIARVESHYLRANTTREFIDGGLTLAALHRDYESQRKALNKEAASIHTYAHIFNTEFNISFFVPKKDACNFCESYKNSTADKKAELAAAYESHQNEKKLTRLEKAQDIEMSRRPDSNVIVAIYDLQAQLPVPIGNSSAFFYKSKLNCYNFTVSTKILFLC